MANSRGLLAAFRRRNGERRVLVRVREHIFLSGRAEGRRARRSARREPYLAAILAWADLHGEGWRDSPFNVYPAKGRYMWHDLERTCGAMGVPLKRPEPFPQPSLLAARVALTLEGDERSDFSRRVFLAEFGQGLPIDDRASLGALLAACGVDPAAAFERAESAANKALLKAECARATEIGVVGAPCLVTEDGEVFWGNDRLEQGLDWAAGAGLRRNS
jgi:2-hydroxychromene-2-carboxylate isomerase